MALPNHHPTADDQLVDAGEFSTEFFWYKHRQSILILAVVTVIAAAITVGWLIHSHSVFLAAQTAVAEAHDEAGWREVIAKYPTALPTANACFLLADSLSQQGKYADAIATFQKFLDTFPTHPLVGGAWLGIAENTQAMGKDEDALQSLRDLQVRNSSSYAAPFATYLEARILLDQGKLEDAQRVVTGMVRNYPNSPVAEMGNSLLEEIDILLPPSAKPLLQ